MVLMIKNEDNPTGNYNYTVSNYSALKQKDKYQTGAVVIKKKNNECVSVPLYTWDLCKEVEELMENNPDFSEPIEIFNTLTGDEIALLSGIRLFEETFGILPELYMEPLRTGLWDLEYKTSPTVPVFRYEGTC